MTIINGIIGAVSILLSVFAFGFMFTVGAMLALSMWRTPILEVKINFNSNDKTWKMKIGD